MGRALQIGLFLGVVVAWFVPAVSAEGQAVPAVQVVLHNSTSAPEQTVSEAREFSTTLFMSAGITLAADDATLACPAKAAGRFCVQVMLRPRHPEFQPGKVRTMGVALAADAHRAVVTVYLDAVFDVARRYGQPLGKVLGVALAHEIGHVLLPPPSHSTNGIMQPSWEGDALRHVIGGDIAFTEEQAVQMRGRLMNRVSMP